MKKSIQIAAAFVSLVVGAGFASGQEIMQYFTSFGVYSVLGCLIATLLFTVFGMKLAQIGSDLQTTSHKEGILYIGGRFFGPVLDQLISFILFGIAIVMLAGAGAILHQMFGIRPAVGSLLMAMAVIVTLLLNAESIIHLLTAFMPYLVGMIFILSGFALLTADGSVAELHHIAQTQPAAATNWLSGAILYVSYNLAAGAAMLIVMGGTTKDRKVAATGGALGGLLLGLLIFLVNLTLFAKIEGIAGAEMPTLALAEQIHPLLGIVMAVILLAMIYSTAVGTLYVLAVRIVKPKPLSFQAIVLLLCTVSFAISLVGFTALIGSLYVLMGYLGCVLMLAIALAFKRGKDKARVY